MPGIYREKTCPRCSKIHRRRGPFCSRECGNIREFTEDQKKAIAAKTAEKMQDWLKTPEGIANAKMLGAGQVISSDEYAVDLPDLPDIDDLEYYERAEKW